MPSTVAIGDELRDHVIDLLEARGFPVQREVRLNTKRIDILLEQEDELRRRRIAIEVKNYGQNLSQEELTGIYAGKLSLLQSREIDEIWVIVRRDYSPEAKNWATAQPGLSLFTIAEFEERQFGFRRYVRQLIELFSEDDLDRYYVQQRISETQLLKDRIQAWIEGKESHPVAILGGYGMGKTSFCKFLVAELGKAYLEDPLRRVPIYIRLSEIAKEQELDGLLGKMLASRYRLNNYNFQDVLNLNRRGKFVFIFDGFDEMKHALTWELFKYNFGQINRTVEQGTRVLIAGRPNAFLSDDEHNWALRGTRTSGERLIRMPDWPEYEELYMQPFSGAECRKFLRLYLENDARKNNSLDAKTQSLIDTKIREYEALTKREDFSRPVHLKIFAQLATRRDFAPRAYTVFELYDLATTQTIDREMEKIERLKISSEDRAKFIQDIAWWLWEKDNGRSLHFQPSEVPASIWRRITSTEQEASEQGLMRELFSGAFIERKFGENFYFAHRSFLEFFVAKMLIASRSNQFSLGLINSTLNQEILNFLQSSGRFEQFVEYVIELMHRYVGELKLILLSAIWNFLKRNDRVRAKIKFQQHVDLLFKALPLYEADSSTAVLECIDALISKDLISVEQDRPVNALFFLLDTMIYDLKNPDFAEALEKIVRILVSFVDFKYWYASKAEVALPRLAFSRGNVFEIIFLRSARVAAELAPDGAQHIVIDFGKMLAELAEIKKPKVTVVNRVTPVEAGQYLFSLRADRIGLSRASDLALLAEILRQGADARTRP